MLSLYELILRRRWRRQYMSPAMMVKRRARMAMTIPTMAPADEEDEELEIWEAGLDDDCKLVVVALAIMP